MSLRFFAATLLTIFAILCLIVSAECEDTENDADFIEISNLCNKDHKLPEQPELKKSPIIRKCCREDLNLHIINSTIENFGCHSNNYPIFVNYSLVELFDDCIFFRNRSAGEILLRSSEKPVDHEYFPCMYYGDLFGFHIIQNGSLLETNTYGHFYYRIHDDFCIEANAYNGAYMVCQDKEAKVTTTIIPVANLRHRSLAQKCFTIISIPCFIGIAIFYLFIKELRNLHGIYVVSLQCFMTVEFILRSVLNSMKLKDILPLHHTVQYFDLMNHFWLLVLFTNSILFTWFYLPYKKVEWRPFAVCSYGIFFICCLLIPTIISKGFRENEVLSLGEFFTTPKTTIVLTCILLLIIIFMGSKRLKAIIKNEILRKYYQNSIIDDHDIEMQEHYYELEEVQNRLTCLTSLAGFMVILRIFYVPGHTYLVLIRRILKSSQGLTFVLIFIALRYREVRTFVWRKFK